MSLLWVIEVLPPKPKLRAPAAHLGSTFYSHFIYHVLIAKTYLDILSLLDGINLHVCGHPPGPT